MAPPDALQVTLRGLGPDSEELISVLYYVLSDGGGTVDAAVMDTISDAFDTALAPKVLPPMSGNCRYGNTYVKIWTGADTGFESTNSAHSLAFGTAAGDVGNVERCAVIRKTTGLAGRRNRGRTFAWCPPRDMFFPGGDYNPANAADADIQALAVALSTRIDVLVGAVTWSFDPVVWHRSLVTFTYITGAAVSAVAGIQRRRRIGVGA